MEMSSTIAIGRLATTTATNEDGKSAIGSGPVYLEVGDPR